ncbi:MAG: substrate-binding domain-containing protein, partial [Pseudomonadota bacterium]
MKLKQTLSAFGVAALVAGTFGASSTAAMANTIIKVDGSSTVFPITEAVAEEFQKSQKSTKVTVGVSGTGGGFKKFCRGETD